MELKGGNALASEVVDDAEHDFVSLLWPTASGETGEGDLSFEEIELASPDSGGVGDVGVDREPVCAAEKGKEKLGFKRGSKIK